MTETRDSAAVGSLFPAREGMQPPCDVDRRRELEERLDKGGLTTSEMSELAWLRAQKEKA